jgi:protein tyrosine phosphatase (PTP) superfamily phosphohydrolase (DUF442 family)
MTPELAAIQGFRAISPLLLTAGQPLPGQFEAIRAAGCQVVINLATPVSSDFLPDEAQRVTALGLDYLAIPVEWLAPQPADLQAFFQVMQRYQGQRVFVHCARNMRVSAFVFLYRVLQLKEARTICQVDLDALWQPNPVWQAFIDAQLAARAS